MKKEALIILSLLVFIPLVYAQISSSTEVSFYNSNNSNNSNSQGNVEKINQYHFALLIIFIIIVFILLWLFKKNKPKAQITGVVAKTKSKKGKK